MSERPSRLPRWLTSLAGFAQAFAPRARALAVSSRERVTVLLRRALPSESQHLFALTIVVGLVCGLVAVAFHLGIKRAESLLIDRAMHADGNWWMAWTVITPVLGGLLAGALLTYVVPGARGSGIPQVKTAFALEGGRIRVRDAFGKFFIGILQIGSGASLGREGPTVQICAGATSLLARATALPAKNMRRLLPVGVAAGIAAAFNAPIAAVTFTIEEIVGSLDNAVLSGVVVAAALAAVIERSVLGVHPVIEVQQPFALDHASSLLLFAVLGLAGGLVSVAFTDGLLKLRLWFRDLRAIPRWMHPAVGGGVTGLLAVLILKLFGTTGVTGGGYEALGKALAGQLGLKVLLSLCAVKLIATVFSYSSGGAGGIFAPALFIGAMLGGVMGYVDVALFQHEERQLGAFALVGMGAVFAGVIRAPITSVLIIFEMTGGYGLVLPLMLANMTAYGLAKRLRPTPIYEALLEQDGVVLPHGAPREHALDRLTVRDAMSAAVVSVRVSQTVGEVRALLQSQPFTLAPVLDAAGALVGALPLAEARAAAEATPVAKLMRRVDTVLDDVSRARAVVQMNDSAARQLVVLDGKTASQVVGVVSITDLVRAYAKVPPLAPLPPPHRTGGIEELCARDLAVATPTVVGSSSVEEFMATLAASPSGAVVVEVAAGPPGIILLEHVRDFLRDDQVQRMLVASDVMRPLPTISPEAGQAEIARLCVASNATALLLAPSPGSPHPEQLVLTRTMVGESLLRSLTKDLPLRAH